MILHVSSHWTPWIVESSATFQIPCLISISIFVILWACLKRIYEIIETALVGIDNISLSIVWWIVTTFCPGSPDSVSDIYFLLRQHALFLTNYTQYISTSHAEAKFTFCHIFFLLIVCTLYCNSLRRLISPNTRLFIYQLIRLPPTKTSKLCIALCEGIHRCAVEWIPLAKVQ